MANKKFSDYSNVAVPADGDILLYENAATTNSLNQTYAQLKADVGGNLWEISGDDLSPQSSYKGILIDETSQYKISDESLDVQQTSVPNTYNTTDAWQSWTNSSTVFLSAISFYKASSAAATINLFIYSGEGTGGSVIASKALVSISAGTGFRKINLTAPVSITSGTYTVRLGSGSAFDWGIAQSNVYAGGRFSADANWDAGFEIYTASEYTYLGQNNLLITEDFFIDNVVPATGDSTYFRIQNLTQWIRTDDTNYGSVTDVGVFEHMHEDTTTFGTNGVGAALQFLAPNSGSISGVQVGKLQYLFSDVTSGSEKGQVDMILKATGVDTNVLSVDEDELDLKTIDLVSRNKTTSYTTVTTKSASDNAALTNASEIIEYTNGASDYTFTIPPNASVAFPIGTWMEIRKTGTGEITIAKGGGVTFRGSLGDVNIKIDGADGFSLFLEKTATDTWLVSGAVKGV